MKRLVLIVILALLVLPTLPTLPAMAVQPNEILDDPALEARARDLSKGLRCLVCRNESIDDSHADLARDLRLLVRERLVAGDSDEQVISFVVDRYGEYVLLKPQTGGSNLLLWLAGPLMLLIGGGMSALYLRRRATAQPEGTPGLSAAEQARLDDILRD